MVHIKKNILYIAVPVVIVSSMLIAGCNEQASNQAITIERTPAPLSQFSSVPVLLADGKTTTISKIGYPFYVIAFVETPTDNPCYISPEVQSVAKKLWLDSVNVIQVSVPSSSKMFTENVMNVCTPPRENLVRVFDQDRLTWNRFNRPLPGTLLLINSNGTVASSGTLSHPENVLFDTERLSDTWNEVNNLEINTKTF